LQASGASDPLTLQSQIRPYPQNRLSINALAVVHGRLIRTAPKIGTIIAEPSGLRRAEAHPTSG
jgi:hypothetical protein